MNNYTNKIYCSKGTRTMLGKMLGQYSYLCSARTGTHRFWDVNNLASLANVVADAIVIFLCRYDRSEVVRHIHKCGND